MNTVEILALIATTLGIVFGIFLPAFVLGLITAISVIASIVIWKAPYGTGVILCLLLTWGNVVMWATFGITTLTV